MLISCDSYKDVREMEYEFFRSKLKPLVDRSLIPSIIERSSSGEHPHHAVAMGLVLEKSIQERRERISKIKNASQLNSQAERNTEAPTIAIQQAQHLASVPALQPLSQSSSSFNLASASARTKALPDSTHTVKLKCIRCDATTLPSGRWFHGPGCPGGALKCAACGTEKIRGTYTCTNCHGKPMW